MTTQVLVVDDHAVFAETLAASLSTNPDIEVVGVATTAAEGHQKAARQTPDVALVDLGLPDMGGVDLARRLRTSSSRTRVVILTGDTDAALFPQAMAAGACGYLIKDAGLAEVTDAIRRAAAGQVVVPENVAARLTAVRTPASGPGSDLTRREAEVLRLLSEGGDVRAIAKSLGITWHTARSYVKTLLVKLDAHSQLEAVAKAIRMGILRVRDSS